MLHNISTADEDLALELGAKLVRKDGSVFNAAGRSGVSRLPVNRQSAPPPPQPEPPPHPAPDNSALLEKLVQMLALMQQPQPQAAPEINIPAPVVTVQPAAKVLEWDFTFSHNPDGSIKSIKAKAS